MMSTLRFRDENWDSFEEYPSFVVLAVLLVEIDSGEVGLDAQPPATVLKRIMGEHRFVGPFGSYMYQAVALVDGPV